MLANIFLRNIALTSVKKLKPISPQLNLYCSKRNTEGTQVTDVDKSFLDKFKIFQDSDSGIVYDIEEEKSILEKYTPTHLNEHKKKYTNIYCETELDATSKSLAIDIDIERLVTILRDENACNICVIKVPSGIKYVDYLCITNGKSYRHMIGIAEYVRKTLKSEKRVVSLPKIEGDKSREWIAMDLGNVALHIFDEKSRKVFDLESLWCLGPEYEKFRGAKPIDDQTPPAPSES